MKKDFFNKNKNKLLILVVMLVIITLVILFNRVDVEKFIQEKGFVKYDQTMYYQKLSKLTKAEYEKKVSAGTSAEYDYLYFGLGTNHMSEEIGVYDNNVKLEYIGEYSYKSNTIIYSLRGEYNSTVIQFTGKYDINTESFTCESLLHHNINYDNELESSVCKLTKSHSINLYNNSVNLIDNKKVLKKIIKNTDG